MKNWVNESVFYHMYPLGFTGAPQNNEGDSTKGDRILQVIDWIPHMKGLGVNALYIGPLFESASHGYDTNDYYKIDSRLGTNDDFKKVCKALKDADIKIILDGVFNHVGRGFWAFNDLQKNRDNSPYVDWFKNVRFDQNNGYNDGFSYEAWHGYEVLINLNLYNPDVKKHLLDAVEMWIDEFDIDGIRLDAVDCVGVDFCKELRKTVDRKKSDFWLMGEIVDGGYQNFLNPEVLDSATNYECYKGLYSSFNCRNLCEIIHSITRQKGPYGIYKDYTLYNFADNHDVNRVASVINDKRDLFSLYSVMFTMPGVPSIYYGSEWAIEGQKAHGTDAPLRPYVDVNNPNIVNPELMEHIKNLSKIRKESKALKYGSYEQVLATPERSIFARKYEDETVLVFINICDSEQGMDGYFEGNNYHENVPAKSTIIKKL